MDLKKKLDNLCEKIEHLRSSLMLLISYHNLTDEPVIDCSQELDKLLTEYETFKKKYFSKDAA